MSSYNKHATSLYFIVLVPGILKNKTVTEGNSVTLSCKIHSLDFLSIRKLIHKIILVLSSALYFRWGKLRSNSEKSSWDDKIRGSLIPTGKDGAFYRVWVLFCTKSRDTVNISEQEAQESSWLKISEKFLHADGSHLSTLRIVSANVDDSGKYICVVFRKGKKYFWPSFQKYLTLFQLRLGMWP